MSVQSVFSESGAPFNALEPLVVIPEHKVPLPGGSRPSQNDIWILAKAHDDLVSIAVEGKVSEPFGPTMAEWLVNESKGKRKRLEFLKIYVRLRKICPGNHQISTSSQGLLQQLLKQKDLMHHMQ